MLDGIRDAIAAATRSNVSIYAIDPRGLTSLGDDTIETGMFADQRRHHGSTTRPDATPEAQRQTGIGMSSLRNELQVSQDSLRTLSDETTDSRRSMRTISARHSSGSSARTARITCWPTIRPHGGATASSIRSKFAPRVPASRFVHGGAMSSRPRRNTKSQRDREQRHLAAADDGRSRASCRPRD